MNTKDLKMNEPAFSLYKGDPKTGKSIAAHSFPDTYTFSFDRRMQSVKSFYRGRDFEYDYFNNLIEVNQKLDAFKAMQPGTFPYKTVIFDGITRFSDLAIECMIDHRNPSPNSKTVRAGIPMAEIEDYGGESRALTMALNGLLAINIIHKVHVIVIAHVIAVEQVNVLTKSVTVTRSLLTAGKKIAAKLPVDFNEVYHFYVTSDVLTETSVFRAATKSNSLDWAATCMPLPKSIIWTNKNFFEELQKSIAGDSMFT